MIHLGRGPVLMNKQISLAFVATYAGWLTAIAVWIISWIVGSTHLGQGAILVAIIAAATTSRLWAQDRDRKLHNALTIVSGAVSTVTPMTRH